MKNETERKRQTQDKGHNILNIIGKIIGIGIGTVLAVIFVGRVVAISNHFLKTAILKLSGLEREV